MKYLISIILIIGIFPSAHHIALFFTQSRTTDDFPERGTLGENQEISIEEGKFADFVIVDKNIFEIPANEISDAKVLQTYFQGNNVFDSNLPQQQDDYDKLIEAIEGLIDEEFIMGIQKYGS